MMRCECGYLLSKKLDGFPQRRRRLFLVGYHQSTKQYKKILEDKKNWISKSGVLAKSCPIGNVLNYDSLDISNDDILTISDTFNLGKKTSLFENTGCMIEGKVITTKTISNYDGEYVLLGDIIEKGKVEVEGTDGQQQILESDHVLVATGCKTRDFPDLPFNGKSVVGSSEAMVMENQPKDIIIIGAGAIGVEFAYFFNAFGTKVTIVEMMPNILPVEDQEVSAELEKSFKKSGIEILSSTKVIETKDLGNGVEITIQGDGSDARIINAEVALIAIGVAPVLPADFEVDLDRGYIVTDDNYQTSAPGIYAVGDIIGPPWLAHVASFEAIQCVTGLFTDHQPKKVGAFPGCTYCQPQVASVGLTEQACKEKELSYKVGKFPYQASGKAQAAGETEGFIKIIIGEPHGEILGAHIIGSEATELIAELGLAIESELTYEEIENTIHAHPTLSEMVHEAVGASEGKAIHF